MRILISILSILICYSGWATDHFVDSLATGANNGSDWANAWTSPALVNRNVNIHNGDTLYISGGPFGSSKTYTPPVGFTTASNLLDVSSMTGVTVRPGQTAAHGGIVIFDIQGQTACNLAVRVAAATNPTFDGTPYIEDGQNHLVFTNGSTAAPKGSHQVFGASVSGTGLTIKRCSFSVGDIICSLAAVNRVTVQDCYFEKSPRESLLDFSSAGSATNTIYDINLVTGCTFRMSASKVGGVFDGGGADAIKGCRSLTVSNCLFYVVEDTAFAGQHIDGIQAGLSYTKCLRNTFIDMPDGAFDNDTANGTAGGHQAGNHVIVENNLIYDTITPGTSSAWIRVYDTSAATAYATNIQEVYILNNTLVDSAPGAGGNVAINVGVWNSAAGATNAVNANGYGATATNVFVMGNLLVNCTHPATTLMQIFQYQGTFTTNDCLVDYNAIMPGAHGGTNIHYFGVNLVQQHSSSTTLPAFVQYTELGGRSNNLRLLLSDTIANGFMPSQYFTKGNILDYDLANRPVAAPWDAGCFQISGPRGHTL